MADRLATDEEESWLDRMNREFQEAARRWSTAADPLGSLGGPEADVLDRDDSYMVSVDLPGFETDEVNVRIGDDALLIDAERIEMTGVDEDSFVRRERTQESVSRRITFPDPVDHENVEATLEQGVLRVEVPKETTTDRGTEIDIA